jgi:YD repeat-containing protein
MREWSIAVAALLLAVLPAAASSWTTGTYVYDGSGNITSIGTDAYRYDASGRLKTSTARTPANANTQTFTYDPYGRRRRPRARPRIARQRDPLDVARRIVQVRQRI